MQALGKGGCWAADGTIYFAPNYASGIFAVAAAGGEPVAITVADSTRGEVSHRFPRMLPDQKHFIYLSRTVSARSGSQGDAGIKLKVASTDGKTIKEIMPAESNAIFSNGHLLFTRNGFLVAQKLDTDTFELSGEPLPLADHLRNIPGASWSLFDVSSNGTMIYESGAAVEGNRITWVDLKGQKLASLGEAAQHDDPYPPFSRRHPGCGCHFRSARGNSGRLDIRREAQRAHAFHHRPRGGQQSGVVSRRVAHRVCFIASRTRGCVHQEHRRIETGGAVLCRYR
jgi:hypothetical protein